MPEVIERGSDLTDFVPSGAEDGVPHGSFLAPDFPI